MRVEVTDLKFDDANTDKLHSHGVTVREARQVLLNAPRFLRNRSEGGAPFVLIGPTFGGRFITLPIDPTDERGVWRPRTGYPSRANERARYDKVHER